MKKLFPETVKVVGTSTRDSWSQTHFFSPEDREKNKIKGGLMAVLSLSGLGAEIEAVALGREAISRLQEEYFGKDGKESLECLKEALEKIQKELGGAARVEVVVAVFLDSRLYLGVLGNGRALLLRDGRVGEILAGTGEVATASGYLKAGDLVLLGTETFFKTTAIGVLRAALFSNSLIEMSETLAAVIHGQEESGAAAALIARFRETAAKSDLLIEPKRSDEAGGISSETFSPSFPKKILFSSLNAFSRVLGGTTIRRNWSLADIESWLKIRLGKQRSAKSLLTTVALLVLLLTASVGFGWRQREERNVANKTAQVTAEARQKIIEAEALLELNPSRSRDLLLEAEALVAGAGLENLSSPEMTALESDLKKLMDKVIREKRVETKSFFDLELIKQGASGERMALSGGRLFVLDKKLSSLYEIELENKKMAVVAGGKALEGASQVAAYLPQVWVLGEKEILVYNRQTGRESVAGEIGESGVVDLEAFSGNLYELNMEGLWQYPAVEGGLGGRRDWLKEETAFDFRESRSLAIDGSIWVVTGDGNLAKFTRGRQEAFGVAGLDFPLEEVTALFTDENQKNLYLLGAGGIVAIDKSGEYQAAYLSDNLAGATDLVVSEEAGKIWVLKGREILEVNLKIE